MKPFLGHQGFKKGFRIRMHELISATAHFDINAPSDSAIKKFTNARADLRHFVESNYTNLSKAYRGASARKSEGQK